MRSKATSQQYVYLKSIVLSRKTIPFLSFPFAYQKHAENNATIQIITICDPMLTQIAIMYLSQVSFNIPTQDGFWCFVCLYRRLHLD